MKPAALIRRYRKVTWGRLYWHSKRFPMKAFDSDDVCIVRNGVITTHYKTLEALVREIEEREAE